MATKRGAGAARGKREPPGVSGLCGLWPRDFPHRGLDVLGRCGLCLEDGGGEESPLAERLPSTDRDAGNSVSSPRNQ